MDYRNSQTKLETLVQYFNEQRMNLIPLFQRPKVWPLKMRKELIKNIVNGRPIPAIFMYKDVAGSAFKFNILNGKQRLDSIVMFLANDDEPAKFGVKNWSTQNTIPLRSTLAVLRVGMTWGVMIPMSRNCGETWGTWQDA